MKKTFTISREQMMEYTTYYIEYLLQGAVSSTQYPDGSLSYVKDIPITKPKWRARTKVRFIRGKK